MTILGTTCRDWSGTITAGGTVQTLAPANSERKAFYIQNDSDTDMKVSMDSGAPATATVGYLVEPGYYWEPPVPPVGKVTIYCATTGKAFSAAEFS